MDREIGYVRNDIILFNLLAVFFLVVITAVLLYTPDTGSISMFIPLTCLVLNVIVAYNFGLQRGMLFSILFTLAYGSYVIYDTYKTGATIGVEFAPILWMAFFPIAGLLAGNLSLVVDRYRSEMESKKSLEKLVSIDTNTGLHKESEFFRKLDAEFQRARRHGKDLSILVIQILNYDELYAIYGEADVVNILKSVCEYMCRELRICDTKFAIGRGKLSILLAETNGEGARKVAEKLHMSLERVTTTIRGDVRKVVRIKPGIGMASLCEGDGNALELYNRAIEELTYDKG